MFWLFKAGGPCLKTVCLEDKSKTYRCLPYQFYKQLAKLDNKFSVYVCPVSLFSSTAPSSALPLLLKLFVTASPSWLSQLFSVQLPYLQTLLLHSALKWAAKSPLNFSSGFLLLLQTQKASSSLTVLFVFHTIYICAPLQLLPYHCPHYYFLSFLSFPHTQSSFPLLFSHLCLWASSAGQFMQDLFFLLFALYSLTTNTPVLC